MNIKILSDSTCDLSPEILEKHNITIIPLTVIKDGNPYSDGIDITTDDIFAHVAAGGGLCSTAAINAAEYQQWFEKYSKDYDGVIHINISSEFSCSHQNARLAAEDYPNVRVIDSRNLSTGQGLVVLEACKLAATCNDLDEIKSKLDVFTTKVEASFLLDRLDYMVKGGRCSAVVALGANLLGLKPCIEVKDGKMAVVKKYRGNYAKCLASYVKDRLHDRDDLNRETLFVTRTPVSDTCLGAVKAAVDEYANFETIHWTMAGCTVSCHCGPGTLGVLFVRK
ncbi:MAG: DegV family protein [Oscillospiraceae bacterium]|nr:DegV family protein [Oscillospiraceae bacterium]